MGQELSFLKKFSPNVLKALGILIAGMLFTGIVAYFTKKNGEQDARKDFNLVCNDIKSKIIVRLHTHAQLLRSGSAYFAATDTVTYSKWKKFYESSEISTNLPGVQGLGYSYIIPKDQLKQHIEFIRKHGFPEYNVKPAEERNFYTSIIFLQPFAGRNLRAFGYDMFSEPVRRKAMEISRDSDVVMLSGKVILVQETNKDVQAGTLMYVPVYKNNMPAQNVEQRRAAIKGWVYSPFRMNDLMNGVLGRWDASQQNRIRLQIYDSDSISSNALLFDSQLTDSVKTTHEPTLAEILPIEFNGKKWSLLFIQSSNHSSYFQSKVFTVLVSGTIISLLLFFLSLSLLSVGYRAQQIAKQLTSELFAEKERFQTLLNSAAESIYGIDRNGNCTFANISCVQTLGYKSSNELLGKNMHELIHHSYIDGKHLDSKDCKIVKAFCDGIGTHDDNDIFWKADGSYFPAEYWSYPIYINGNIEGAVVTFFNITKRKQAENALKESEERWKYALEGASNGVWDWNMETNKVFYSPQWKKLLGLSNKELSDNFDEWSKRIHPDDMQSCLDALQLHIDGKKPDYSNVYRIQCFDGSYKRVLDRGKIMVFDNNNKPSRMIGTITDITDQIKMEEALRESEAKSSAILEILPDMMFIQNNDGVFIDCFIPDSATTIVSPDLFLGKNMREILPSDVVNQFIPIIERAIKTKQLQLFEYSLMYPDRLHFFEARIICYEENKILSIVRNITERKDAEEQLLQTRVNYETFFNTIDDFLFVLDEEGNIIHSNETVKKRLGYAPQELLGKSVLTVHPPERREEAGRIVGNMLAGKAEFCPVPLITKQGIQIPVETRISHGFWDGKPVIFGVTKDISQIRLSEEKFSKLFYINPSACGLSDLITGHYLEVNNVFYSLFEFEKEEVIGKSASELGIMPLGTREAILQKADINGNVYNVEVELRTKSGNHLHVLLSSENIYIQDKEFRFTVVNDITERKHAEEALYKSNKRLEAIILASPDGIGVISLDGKLQLVSDRLAEMYGYSTNKKEEFIGKPIYDLIDSSCHSLLTENFRKLISQKKDQKITEYLAVKKDKSLFYVDVNSTVLLDASSNPESILFVERDITERKQVENEIKQASMRLSLATRAGGVGIWDYDLVNGSLLWDDQMFALYGIKKESFEGTYDAWLKNLHPDEVKHINDEIQLAICGEKEFDTEFRACWPDE